jgi:AcrR family transcriptional regulator
MFRLPRSFRELQMSRRSKATRVGPVPRTQQSVEPPQARPYHHGALKKALLHAAARTLAAHGERAVTVRAVAAAAGVSPAALYHHFPGRDALLAALAAEGFVRLREGMRAAARKHTLGSSERLSAVAQVYVRLALDDPARFRLMFSPLLARKHEYPALEATALGAFHELETELLAVSSPASLPREKSPAAHATEHALAAWSLVHGLATLWIDDAIQSLAPKGATANALASSLARMLLGGLTH